MKMRLKILYMIENSKWRDILYYINYFILAIFAGTGTGFFLVNFSEGIDKSFELNKRGFISFSSFLSIP